MADEAEEQRARAEELRRQISGINSETAETDEGAEIKPGESPKEYLERRSREMEKKSGEFSD